MQTTREALEGWSCDEHGHHVIHNGCEVRLEPLRAGQFYLAVYDTKTQALLAPKVILKPGFVR